MVQNTKSSMECGKGFDQLVGNEKHKTDQLQQTTVPLIVQTAIFHDREVSDGAIQAAEFLADFMQQ